ncbi:MAG: MogA/MoaB family molybdenum cofactor biosynthesis protein [Treponema sp.]|nr:MogA/MoaB family molybdenum cofactor biosynthesis protein [Treponema sp.]
MSPENNYRVGIITSSDSCAAGEREDISGKVIKEIVISNGCRVESHSILPDEQELIEQELERLCDTVKVDLILTTGGTGFSPRDCTPEATLAVAHRIAPGIAEAIRQHSMTITKRAMLSRAVSAIRGKTLIVNLPGSPKAVRESLEYIIDELGHGLDILTGRDGSCADHKDTEKLKI